MKDEGRGTREWYEMIDVERGKISSVRELKVYQLGFDTAMEIFDISSGNANMAGICPEMLLH